MTGCLVTRLDTKGNAMTIALESPARSRPPPSGPPNRWITIAPVAVLMTGMLGFTWLQITADADRSIAAQAIASPVVLPLATSERRPTAPTAPAEDAVPSLEDQELASYATCGA